VTHALHDPLGRVASDCHPRDARGAQIMKAEMDAGAVFDEELRTLDARLAQKLAEVLRKRAPTRHLDDAPLPPNFLVHELKQRHEMRFDPERPRVLVLDRSCKRELVARRGGRSALGGIAWRFWDYFTAKSGVARQDPEIPA